MIKFRLFGQLLFANCGINTEGNIEGDTMIKITGYAKLLIWKSEGGVRYPLVPCSKHSAKADRRTRGSRQKNYKK